MGSLHRTSGRGATLVLTARLALASAALATALATLPACVNPVKTVEVPMPAEAAPAIPERTRAAVTGSEFVSRIGNLSREEREVAIEREILRGNVPDHLRRFRTVHLSMSPPGGGRVDAVVWVMPDYLAVGSSDDFVRVPMNPVTAQRIADLFGCSLPTRKLVDEIYRQAQLKLEPQPMAPGPEMVSSEYFRRHNDTISQQIGANALDRLVAGHKKDVVLTNRNTMLRDRVAIYGWHRQDGQPIQPLSLVHGYKYADYSHGIRLVAGTMLVNGRMRSVRSVMSDPALAPLLSDEGAISMPRFDISDRLIPSAILNLTPWRQESAAVGTDGFAPAGVCGAPAEAVKLAALVH